MARSSTGRTLANRILRAGFAVSIAHILFKLAGLWQARVMGQTLSAETYDVVYGFAFENCIFSLFLIGEEVISPACLPIFMREKDEQGEEAAWSFANIVLTLQFILLAVVVVVLMRFAGPVTQFLTSWSPDNHPERYQLASESVRRLAPSLIGFSLGSLTYVLLNSYKRFFLAAFGNALWKFAVVGALILYSTRTGEAMVQVLIGGLVAGSVLKLLAHLVGLRDKLHFVRPRIDFKNPALRRMLWLALPLLLGIIFAKVRDVVNNVYILGKLDTAGLIQANSMGRKLQNSLHWLVPYTLSIAVFPFFCELVDNSDHERLGGVVTRVGRQLLAIFIPFAVIVAALAIPLTGLIYGGGRFDSIAINRTAISMAFYTFALPAAAVEVIIMQAFFANHRMLATTLAGIVFSAFSILVSWAGLVVLEQHPLALLGVVAGGFTLSRALKTVALVQLFKRSAPVFPWGATLWFMARVMLASVAAGAGAWAASWGIEHGAAMLNLAERLSDVARLAAGGAAAAVVLLGAYALLRIDEPFELVRLAWDRVRKRGAG